MKYSLHLRKILKTVSCVNGKAFLELLDFSLPAGHEVPFIYLPDRVISDLRDDLPWLFPMKGFFLFLDIRA